MKFEANKEFMENLSLHSTLNHHIFTQFVQRRSFLSSCYRLNLNKAFKVKNLVPMTMHRGRCHWTCALYQVLVRMLMQKRPLLHITQLYNTSNSYCFSKAVFGHYSEDLDKGQFLYKNPEDALTNKRVFHFEKCVEVSIVIERASRFVRKLPEISVAQLKHFQRCKQFSK